MSDEPALTRHVHGVTTVDAMYVRPGFAAVHILERGGRAAIVDTGTTHSVPHVLSALQRLGLEPGDVELVFLTHVHLDHAGGAGALLERLPAAKVVVHPRGAPHIVDPERLEAATRAVYGDARFDALYGGLKPVPRARVIETSDLGALQLGPSSLRVLHTPGHALHHQVLFDAAGRAVFTGDTFGLSYRSLDTARGAFIVPTTTPTQFDPEQLELSIRRIVELEPEAVYLTHYGRVEHVPELARALLAQLAEHVAIAERHAAEAERRALIAADLRDFWMGLLQSHGVADSARAVDAVLADDVELNAQGLVAWLERRARSSKPAPA